MNYEINREIVFSTQHISLETANYLATVVGNRSIGIDHDFPYQILANQYCYRICIDHNFIPLEKINHLDLKHLIDLAIDNDCKWLTLDINGPIYPDLVQFDWSRND